MDTKYLKLLTTSRLSLSILICSLTLAHDVCFYFLCADCQTKILAIVDECVRLMLELIFSMDTRCIIQWQNASTYYGPCKACYCLKCLYGRITLRMTYCKWGHSPVRQMKTTSSRIRRRVCGHLFTHAPLLHNTDDPEEVGDLTIINPGEQRSSIWKEMVILRNYGDKQSSSVDGTIQERSKVQIDS